MCYSGMGLCSGHGNSVVIHELSLYRTVDSSEVDRIRLSPPVCSLLVNFPSSQLYEHGTFDSVGHSSVGGGSTYLAYTFRMYLASSRLCKRNYDELAEPCRSMGPVYNVYSVCR